MEAACVRSTVTVEAKQLFYRALALRLEAELGLRRADVFVSLVEVEKENWSFGNGEGQYIAAAAPAVAAR
jgi:hypothetical protein